MKSVKKNHRKQKLIQKRVTHSNTRMFYVTCIIVFVAIFIGIQIFFKWAGLQVETGSDMSNLDFMKHNLKTRLVKRMHIKTKTVVYHSQNNSTTKSINSNHSYTSNYNKNANYSYNQNNTQLTVNFHFVSPIWFNIDNTSCESSLMYPVWTDYNKIAINLLQLLKPSVFVYDISDTVTSLTNCFIIDNNQHITIHGKIILNKTKTGKININIPKNSNNGHICVFDNRLNKLFQRYENEKYIKNVYFSVTFNNPLCKNIDKQEFFFELPRRPTSRNNYNYNSKKKHYITLSLHTAIFNNVNIKYISQFVKYYIYHGITQVLLYSLECNQCILDQRFLNQFTFDLNSFLVRNNGNYNINRNIDIWIFDTSINMQNEKVRYAYTPPHDLAYKQQFWIIKHLFHFANLRTIWNICVDLDEYLIIWKKNNYSIKSQSQSQSKLQWTKSGQEQKVSIYQFCKNLQSKYDKYFLFRFPRFGMLTKLCFNYSHININPSIVHDHGNLNSNQKKDVTFFQKMVIRHAHQPETISFKQIYRTAGRSMFIRLGIHSSIVLHASQVSRNSISRYNYNYNRTSVRIPNLAKSDDNFVHGAYFAHMRNYYNDKMTCKEWLDLTDKETAKQQLQSYSKGKFCINNQMLLPNELNPMSLYPVQNVPLSWQCDL